jgi:hypothetical protein
MADESHIEIKGENVRGETLELGNHAQDDVLYGGAFLHKCVVDILGSSLKIVDATFLDCQIRVDDQISNFRFMEAVFERCTFEGTFVNCRFGFRRGESQSPNAYYRNCDFSQATLDNCDFFVGDIDSVTWPEWPNFTVLKPRQNKQDWLSIGFPLELKSMQEIVAGESLSARADEKTGGDNAPQAVTVNLARYSNVDFDLVRTLLESKSYIVLKGI